MTSALDVVQSVPMAEQDGESQKGASQAVTATKAADPPGSVEESSPGDSTGTPVQSLFGVPLAAFVRGGGTGTYADDMRQKAEEADAEKRRDVAAKERRIAATPIEHGGGKIFTNKLTDRPELDQAYVLLDYMTARGEKLLDHGAPVQCLADVVVGVDPTRPKELTLIIVCPRCLERGVPQGQCQLRIRQANRAWHLDTKHAGKIEVFEGKPFRSAGTVMDGERFSCGRCAWSARIDKNRVHPDA